MSERMSDKDFERLAHAALDNWAANAAQYAEARRARASEAALLLERDEARGRAAGLLLEQAANATLRAQVEEMRRALKKAKGERDEARSAIPHPGDGSCARCGSVPTMPVPLCESCDGELTSRGC